MRKLAEHILSVAHRTGNYISNSHLQKTMFFTIGLALNKNGIITDFIRDTYDMAFSKWQHGATLESVYFDSWFQFIK